MLPHALHRGSEQFASMCVANFLASFAHFVARAVVLLMRFVAARAAYAWPVEPHVLHTRYGQVAPFWANFWRSQIAYSANSNFARVAGSVRVR
jgi:hypothetical protein